MANITPDKITKIIAFSLGSISGGEDLDRSITQHVLVLTIKDVLKKMIADADVEIRCYVQDPEYSDVDRTALAGAGIEVLDDPQGFLEVDDSSVVLSFDSAVPVRQIVADLARPAIMIWNKVRSEEEVIQCSSGGGESPICKSLEEIEGGL
ncbi:hypothetical protein N8I77_007096 [Diaporthe amygdali]|uniref:SRR1-like domain-containing protein n=1 Tax=Phomopsis amygdali TaxID=1214568 RepID=A0AAD9SAZ9_PHOAM|nr:hypothetical protein N8I77_007096 [Diaporthe amygdali]